MNALVAELVESDARTILEEKSALKKLEQAVLRGAVGMMAHVNAAADSIARDGIACTSEIEQTLLRDANGMCLVLLTTMLEAGARTCARYEKAASERHGASTRSAS